MRNRLLVSVVLCSAAVLAAGTPAVLTASQNLSESQDLVNSAELNRRAGTLSHSLTDERDAMLEYVASGRDARAASGASKAQRTRVDRQSDEIKADAPASVQRVLRTVPKLRQQAMSGNAGALDIYKEYNRAIDALHRISDSTAQELPGRAQDVKADPAESATAHALPNLARAVDRAAAARGLLNTALKNGGSQRTLTSQAQQERVREQAALADFDSTAGQPAKDAFSNTVNGTDVSQADRYLRQLTDRPFLEPRDRALNRERVETALSARIDRMRGVQSSFASAELERVEQLRDEDVTTLELRFGLVGLCLLIAAGVSVYTARSVARPLSVLSRGSRRLAEDPGGAEAVRFTGRNDEFADVVRAMNTLRDTAVELRDRALGAESDGAHLVSARDELSAERELLRREYDGLREQLDAERERADPGSPQETVAQLALRSLGLADQQLSVIERLEERETDPDQLSTLFSLDHLATRMRRHSENLLLISGAEPTGSQRATPVGLLDVLRAAISEIEHYERVTLGTLPPAARVVGHASDDVSHLLAELLDNATAASPSETQVRLTGHLLPDGGIMLSVHDDGIGMTDERMSAVNTQLTAAALKASGHGRREPAAHAGDQTAPPAATDSPQLGLGLYVVALLAARQGLQVQLGRQPRGGTTAEVALPVELVAPPAPAQGGTQPGSTAEANSHVLPTSRTPLDDPLSSLEGQLPSFSDELPPLDNPLASFDEARSSLDDRPSPLDPARDPAPDSPLGSSLDDQLASLNESLSALTGEHSAEPAAGESPAHEHTRVQGDPSRGGPGTSRQDASPPSAPSPAETGSAPSPQEPGPPPVSPASAPDAGVTGKGLPKRTPKHRAEPTEPQPPPHRGTANADQLRRRLAGFQQGSRDGLRDAAAQLAADQEGRDQAGAQTDGGTAEEARK